MDERRTARALERLAQDRLGLIPPRRRLSEPFLKGIARYAGASFLSASSARPLTGALLCHFTPWRSLKVTCVASGDHSNDSARSGAASASPALK